MLSDIFELLVEFLMKINRGMSFLWASVVGNLPEEDPKMISGPRFVP